MKVRLSDEELLKWYFDNIKILNKTNYSLSSRIRYTGRTARELYDLIHSPRYCIYCRKKTRYVNFRKGYLNGCSNKYCINKYANKNKKIMDDKDIITIIKERIKKSNNSRTSGVKLGSMPYTGRDNEYLYKLYYNIKETPLCLYCGKKCKFINFSRGYNATCGDDICKFKQITNSSYHNHKYYTTPSNKEIKIQGYEDILLDELFKKYNEEDIYVGVEEVPIIKYKYNNKEKLYFPDVYVKSINTIYEVKSGYTYVKELSKNIAKHIYTVEQGFNFVFKIYKGRK